MTSKLIFLACFLAAAPYIVTGKLRLSGGNNARPGQFPYHAAIQYKALPLLPYVTVCGGSIVNEHYILTSAVCASLLPNINNYRVKVGKYETYKDDEHVQTSKVSLRLAHPDFKPLGLDITITPSLETDITLLPSDIGLLKLKTPLNFTEYVKPIKLPPADSIPQGSAVITGFGSLHGGVIPQLPKVLQEAKVKIISNDDCVAAIRALSPIVAVNTTESQICSGPLDKPINACLYDYGDPLVQIEKHEDEKHYVQVGVKSYGLSTCGQKGLPIIYTTVPKFVHWIEERIQEN